MPIVRPFHGILYDPAFVGPIDRVVAPPYDVISPEQQNRLYEMSPYNVIRLDLSRERDRYASASRLFREWRREGALRQDARPAIYAMSQAYRLQDGAERVRWGFFARLRLEEFSTGKVMPHEKTLEGPKTDRLELQRACRANLSSIFGIYSAPRWTLRDALESALGAPPLFDVSDASGVRNALWRIDDPRAHRMLLEHLESRAVYIADGHHRYETALRYRDERRAERGRRDGDDVFDYILAFLSNMDEPGLTVLPTHRLLRELPVSAERLQRDLEGPFSVEALSRAEEEAWLSRVKSPDPGERRIGVVLRDLDRLLILRAADGENDSRLRGSTALRRLDVTLLHGLVLEGPSSLLGLDVHDEAHAGGLVYVKEEQEAIRRVHDGEFAAAFLLNATRVEEVRAVCEAGETMPEKSTYFYPKLLTGLVFHSLED